MFSTLDRYLFREIIVPMGVGLLLFCVVLGFSQLLQVSDAITGLGVGTGDVLQALAYSFPPLMGLLLPVSLLFATLLGVGRIASDRELRGLAAVGSSPYRLLKVPLLMGVLVTLLSGFAMVFGEPWGVRGLRDLMARSAQRALANGVKAGTFNEWLPGVAFFAGERDEDELKGVFFADMRDATRPVVVAAQRGVVRAGTLAKDIVLEMESGNMVMRDDSGASHVLTFDTSRYRLDVAINKAKTMHPLQEKSMGALLSESQDEALPAGKRAHRLVVFHRRLALPLVTLIFVLLAVPLASRPSSNARARGFLYSAGIIAAYYYVGRALELSARAGNYPAVLAPWTPNLVFVLGMTVLLWRFRRNAA